jgi:hypothetical protein
VFYAFDKQSAHTIHALVRTLLIIHKMERSECPCAEHAHMLSKIQISHSPSKLESILLRILPATAPPKPQLLIIEWTYSEMILTKLSLLLPAVHQHC